MKTVSEQTSLRYLLVLKELKNQIDKNPKTRIKAFMRSKKVNDRLTTYVIKSGIVKNNGCPKYPNWEWASIQPNIHMVEKLRGMILDENRDYNKRVRGVNKLPKVDKNKIECFDKPISKTKTKTTSIFWGLIKITKTI